MTPAQAGALMRRGRYLLREGRLLHTSFALLDCLTWTCRAPGADRLSVSYERLQHLAHQARATVAQGVRKLEELGLLRRIRRRVRVSWRGGMASRQATNLYVLLPPTEFSRQTAAIGQVRKQISAELQAALGRLKSRLGTRKPGSTLPCPPQLEVSLLTRALIGS